ncbi:hypothetical protein FACS1894182_12360 [Bacteroidia bacterium]|nr:hypothetical protein FACS1894182_12360 [Bacteroidia bacterium]
MTTITCLFAFFIGTFSIAAQQTAILPSFVVSPYFGEQVLAYTYNPDIRVEVNAPSVADFNPALPTALVFYGLPNGNSTDWTIGKEMANSDDWHYSIQHIGAQTRFIRSQHPGHNLVTIYLESTQKSWGTWRSSHTGGDNIIKECIESIYNHFAEYKPYVVLSGHSGGGNIPFAFIDAASEIPGFVKRISFIDSNYNWDNSLYGRKIADWLQGSDDHFLSVICYNDSVALFNGKPVVSATGGTWYRTRVMLRYLKEQLPYQWTETEDADFLRYSAEDNRIQFILKKNPEQVIYHTVLVERNGYIQAHFSGTSLEGKGYAFWGDHAYDTYIQGVKVYPHVLRIPPRKAIAMEGAVFMEQIKDKPLTEREAAIFNEIANGNVPHSLRQRNRIIKTMADANNTNCTVEIDVLPDFLAIGSDDDFCRIPMLPTTAQQLATLFEATLPTSKISDLAWEFAGIKQNPAPMTPDATMTTVPVFIAHNQLIEEARIPLNKPLYCLIAGHKKDIVISNNIAANPARLYIYGWHYPSGTPIQPVSGAHTVNYVDYSHGVRLVNREIMINGVLTNVRDVLRNTTQYKLLSNEADPMSQTEYTVFYDYVQK